MAKRNFHTAANILGEAAKPKKPTVGDKIVAQIGRLAELRDAKKLNRSDIQAANDEISGEIEFQSDGAGGFIIQFGMMPDPPRNRKADAEEIEDGEE